MDHSMGWQCKYHMESHAKRHNPKIPYNYLYMWNIINDEVCIWRAISLQLISQTHVDIKMLLFAIEIERARSWHRVSDNFIA